MTAAPTPQAPDAQVEEALKRAIEQTKDHP